jgi:tRNA-dihydrouridine synthase
MAADWAKIEAEYITTETSYRRLAEKYRVDQATIARKAKKEDWVSKRQQHISTTQAKIIAADAQQKVDRASRLKSVADKLLDRVEDIVEYDQHLTASAIKNLSDALKNIKEAQMIRTAEDIEEQQARIAKLKKEAQSDSDPNNIPKLVIEGLPEEFKV